MPLPTVMHFTKTVTLIKMKPVAQMTSQEGGILVAVLSFASAR